MVSRALDLSKLLGNLSFRGAEAKQRPNPGLYLSPQGQLTVEARPPTRPNPGLYLSPQGRGRNVRALCAHIPGEGVTDQLREGPPSPGSRKRDPTSPHPNSGLSEFGHYKRPKSD
jgi:hypothetical protein